MHPISYELALLKRGDLLREAARRRRRRDAAAPPSRAADRRGSHPRLSWPRHGHWPRFAG